MKNRDIDAFFERHRLSAYVEKSVRPPNETWSFRAGPFPVLIQTQEEAGRLRIAVFVSDAADLDREHLRRLLEANAHSTLDARYALCEGRLVSAFLHPLHDLTVAQFVLGLYQSLHCAETCGSSFSGGKYPGASVDESQLKLIVEEIVHQIRDG